MTAQRVLDARASAPPAPGAGFIAGLLSIYAAFHVALVLLTPDAAERFMLGDRSNDRSIKLQALLDTDTWDAFFTTLFHQASPGDYIFFAPAWSLGGPAGVMAQNIALIGLGAWFLWKLALLFFPPRVAAIATTAYLLLPATIFHPHAFVSEAICNPLLIAASYFFLRHATAEAPRGGHHAGRHLMAAALLTALLCFTRHVFLPLPLFLAALLLVAGRMPITARLRGAAVLLLAGYALVAAWGMAAHLAKPVYGEGESVGGMEANLFLRAQRMAAMITCPLPGEVERRIEADTDAIQTLPAGDFLKFVRAHPRTFAKTVAYDVFNITANPGMAMVYGRFFGLFDLQEDSYEDYGKWREIRDREGIAGLARELWRTSPLGLILNALGALAWAGFVAVALWGTWTVVWSRTQPLALKLMAVGLPAYLIAFSSVAAGYTRWDHRSPMEFLIALLFAAGVAAIMDGEQGRRDIKD